MAKALETPHRPDPQATRSHRARRPAAPSACACPTRRRRAARSSTVEGLAKSYGGGPPVFEDVDFDVGRGERLLILGLNGAGKTSLLRILAGVTDADVGAVTSGHNVVAGLLRPGARGHRRRRGACSTTCARRRRAAREEQQRALLGMFGLTGDKVFQDAGTLSGGEKTKLALAQLVAGRHNLLLLDEPTNNLDPPSAARRSATALASWPGTMVLVSHDAEFVRDLAPDRALLMPDGDLDYWSDDLLDLVELA